MSLKKIETMTLPDALRAMPVGEARLAPDGCTEGNVKRVVAELNASGYTFTTSTKIGEMVITRLK